MRERRWTIKNKNGLQEHYLSSSRRELERRICSDYVGDERDWSWHYRQEFHEDLDRRLKEDDAEIVEVEMTLTILSAPATPASD